MCGIPCCPVTAKLTVILAWIQTIVYTTTSCVIISAIFIVMLTTDGIVPASIIGRYTAIFAAVPIHLINEILMAVSLVSNNKEVTPTQEELRYSTLAVCLTLLFFMIPAVVTGIYLLKGVLQEDSRCALRTWTVFAVMWFALSIMEVVAGGYVNGIFSMIIYAIAIWIVHKEQRKRRSSSSQNRVI